MLHMFFNMMSQVKKKKFHSLDNFPEPITFGLQESTYCTWEAWEGKDFDFPTSPIFCAAGLLHWLRIQAHLDSFWKY